MALPFGSREEAAVQLAARGYGPEASGLLDQAAADPGRLAFTRDQAAWALAAHDGGGFLTGHGTQHEREAEAG